MKRLQTSGRMLAFIMTAIILCTTLFACAAKENAMDDGFYLSPSETTAAGIYDKYDSNSSGNYKGDVSYDVVTESGSYEPTTQTEPTVGDSARKLIKNVSMDMETKEFDTFLAEVYDRIEMAGGYIQTSNINSGKYSYRDYAVPLRNASVTARIPAVNLDMFCDGVAGRANVVSRHENTSDVTLQYYDTESHMKALQSEYDTLIGILEKCTKLEDVISVQRRITDVLYQIESYKTQLNNYDNLVAYSTVSMSISEVEVVTIVTEQTVGERIRSGISETFREIREDSEDLLVGFTTNLPYLIIWAVVLAVALVAVRGLLGRLFKKRTPKKKEAAETPKDNG